MEEIKYFNVGLLLGLSKVRQDDSSKITEFKRLSDNYEKVMEGASDKCRAHSRFIFYNMKRLPSVGVNWFVPENLGGLGFRVYEEVKKDIQITDFQRCLATYCLRNKDSPSKYLVTGVERYTKRPSQAPRIVEPMYGPYREESREPQDLSINIMNSTLPLLDKKGHILKIFFKSLPKEKVSACRPYTGDMFVKSVFRELAVSWNHVLNTPRTSISMI